MRRSGSTSEELRDDPLHDCTETFNRLGETQSKEVKTLRSHLMNFQWSLERMRNCVRVGIVSNTHFPKDPCCDICLKTKITRAFCRRCTGTVVPWAAHFGDLITADHKTLSEESESGENHRYAVVLQHLATQRLQSHPCKTKLPMRPEEPNEVAGADEETKCLLHKQFLGIWHVLRGIILESLYVNSTQIRNKWDCWKSSSQSERKYVCGTVAARSG